MRGPDGRALCDVIHLRTPGPAYNSGAELVTVNSLVSSEKAIPGKAWTKAVTYVAVEGVEGKASKFFFPGGSWWTGAGDQMYRMEEYSVHVSVGEELVVLLPNANDPTEQEPRMHEWSIFRKGDSGYFYNRVLGYRESLELDANRLIEIIAHMGSMELSDCKAFERDLLGLSNRWRAPMPSGPPPPTVVLEPGGPAIGKPGASLYPPAKDETDDATEMAEADAGAPASRSSDTDAGAE